MVTNPSIKQTHKIIKKAYKQVLKPDQRKIETTDYKNIKTNPNTAP